MKSRRTLQTIRAIVVVVCSATTLATASDTPSDSLRATDITPSTEAAEPAWNWHAQNTDIVQYHPGFPASYSGPNSLSSASDVRETVSLDLYRSEERPV